MKQEWEPTVDRGNRTSDEHAHYLNLREMQLALLDMLKAFDSFCRSHGLAYSLTSGTMLGAIRERGFIPWDDDLDVSMARPDYDRLIALRTLFREETGMDIKGHAELDVKDAAFVKVRHPSIKAHSEYEAHEGTLWIDIFPADGFPVDDAAHLKRCRKVRFNQLALAALNRSPVPDEPLSKRITIRLLKPFSYSYAIRAHFAHRITDLSAAVPYGSTPFAGNLAWGMAGARERMSFEGYDAKVDLEFEGCPFMGMAGWEEYLETVFGEWKVPPPPEQRKNHKVKAWRTESS